MTSLHEFLAKKRQERTRGKLAGLANQIKELKDLGASYKEIAEYLYLAHGVKVTRSGLQKHFKSVTDNRPVTSTPPTMSPTHAAQSEPAAPHHPPSLPQEKAPTPNNAFNGPSIDQGDRIQAPETPSADDVLARYDRNSPEHLAKVAALRQQRAQSKS